VRGSDSWYGVARQMGRSKSKTQNGFSLIEMLVVASIAIIVAAIVVAPSKQRSEIPM
jgi:prepilin-type N-terminal cleavage/methylation domain-containing protein